jgi:hypothetical protein
MAPTLAAERLKAFEERMTGDLIEDLHRLRDVSRPAPIALADLPPSLCERYVGVTGQWLVRAFARDCLWDHEPLQHFTARVQEIDPEATGKPFRTLEGLHAMKSGFEWAGVYAVVAILLVLWFDFRSPSGVLLVMVPLVIGAVATLGILVLVGVPLNPANTIALPLVVGVGVDNGVHVLHDFQQRRPGEPYRLGAATGWGILIAALTTVLGFGALMSSTHRGLISLGFALALGVTCCMIAALVVLPALLRIIAARSAVVAAASESECRRMAA